jgi:hypothetical protein
MHPIKTRSKKKRTVLIVVLALGVGLPPPAQAYLLDFTVSSINPGAGIAYAGSYLSGPPLVESNLKVIDVSRTDNLTAKLSSTLTPHNRILTSPTSPLVDYFLNIPSATSVWMFGGISPQGSITLQGSIPCLNMSDGTTLLSGLAVWRGRG